MSGAPITCRGMESEKLRMPTSGAKSDIGTSRFSSIRPKKATKARDGTRAITVKDDTADQYGICAVNTRPNHSRTVPPDATVQRPRTGVECDLSALSVAAMKSRPQL